MSHHGRKVCDLQVQTDPLSWSLEVINLCKEECEATQKRVGVVVFVGRVQISFGQPK
jgi:hypothetical protein